MLYVFAKVSCHKGKESEFKARLLQLVKECAHHKGLVDYHLHQNNDEPETFFFYECYASEADFAAHSDSPELNQFKKDVESLIAHFELNTWTSLDKTGSCHSKLSGAELSAMDCLLTRRSVRQFTGEALPQGADTQILKAAMAAPSARNCQSWEFIVVRNKDTFEKMMAVHPYAAMLKGADLAIIVCGNLEKEAAPGFWIQDGSAAIQNSLLAARALGIGSTWCGLHPREERVSAFVELFDLPKHIMPLGLVVFGMPKNLEDFAEADRFDSAKIHNESYGK